MHVPEANVLFCGEHEVKNNIVIMAEEKKSVELVRLSQVVVLCLLGKGSKRKSLL